MKISRRTFIAGAPMVATSAFAFRSAWAEGSGFPDRTVTLVAPFGPGGIVDIVSRVIAPSMSSVLGQSVVVENKPGAFGIIGDQYVARSRPNGYRLLVTGNGALIMGAAIYKDLPYNVKKDFAPVGQLVTGSNLIVVRADSPINSIHDLIAYCKAHPDDATYAQVAPVEWLVSSLLGQKTGVKFTRVPYKSTAKGTLAVAAGRVLFGIPPAPVVMHGGKSVGVKVLATIATQRDPAFPNAPTLHEAGIQGVATNTWIGLFAPANTPEAVVAKLNSAVNEAIVQPKAKKLFAKVDLRPAGDTVKAFRQEVTEGVDFWTKVAHQAGISIKL